MKEKQYITYEQATAIAQTGLWDCEDADAVYFDCKEHDKHAVPSTIAEIDKLFENEDAVEIIVCPRYTLAEAIDWLRDEAGIHIQVNNVECKQWSYDLVDINGWEDEDGTPCNLVPERESTPIFNTYEEAVSDAIDKAVEIYTPTEEELNMDDSQFPTMSEEEYNKLRDEIENSDMYDGRGKYDVYECEGCDHHLITTYAVKGVTPFVITCPKCGKGMLHVRTLKTAPAGENVIKWIRPTYEQYCKLSYGYRDHIGNGDLIMETDIKND